MDSLVERWAAGRRPLTEGLRLNEAPSVGSAKSHGHWSKRPLVRVSGSRIPGSKFLLLHHLHVLI